MGQAALSASPEQAQPPAQPSAKVRVVPVHGAQFSTKVRVFHVAAHSIAAVAAPAPLPIKDDTQKIRPESRLQDMRLVVKAVEASRDDHSRTEMILSGTAGLGVSTTNDS